jgi:hypothetical protein
MPALAPPNVVSFPASALRSMMVRFAFHLPLPLLGACAAASGRGLVEA